MDPCETGRIFLEAIRGNRVAVGCCGSQLCSRGAPHVDDKLQDKISYLGEAS